MIQILQLPDTVSIGKDQEKQFPKSIILKLFPFEIILANLMNIKIANHVEN